MRRFVIATLAVLSSSPALGQWLRSDIQSVRDSFSAALNAGDYQKIDTLYAADATLLPPGSEPVHGPTAIERYWAASRSAGLVGIRFMPQQVASAGDLARETGRFRAKFINSDAARIHVVGHYVALWRDTWSGWKLETEIWNANFWP